MRSWVQPAAVTAAVLFALFGTGNCFLLTLFEISGFGNRGVHSRPEYLTMYTLGFTASVMTPALVYRLTGPGRSPSTRALVVAAVAVGAGSAACVVLLASGVVFGQ